MYAQAQKGARLSHVVAHRRTASDIASCWPINKGCIPLHQIGASYHANGIQFGALPLGIKVKRILHVALALCLR